ncbi:CaiB/BaiF CoA transferase family protein [Nocardia alba]|uniref:Crotonobetainyl-CoA:carnitine CoA-transferase CaiB-like acyl-CoA transferase n=1 Tax=Nocardia alba TaxID=225051 RepID=A0A4V2PBI7_9NOCA|nr:CaiB/BaiF CoA-transferase family protein [Nocardia alba]TCJ97565.1 crotonobetainyl-CoA:carnitine CoA-transferase CaiB-like acyl-CoA transferase [Nocardia alba]
MHIPVQEESGGPLAGITVVTLEQAVSAPMCTRTLADLGARVIKIENPDGGDFARHYDDVVHGLAAHFVWANRGKESITLDLKHPDGLTVLHRLLETADAFVANLAPGATAALGISPAHLAQRHPDLIVMEIDGYGAGGPLSHKRAYDLLIQAESGVCAVTGSPGAPAKPGPPIADVSSGLYAALTILAMICGKRAPGGTAGLTQASVSLFDTAAELMGYQLTYTRHTGVDQQPLGMSSPAVAPYGAYRTSDGETVVLGTTNDREWQRLARELLDRPDLADDPRYAGNLDRVRLRAELDTEIARWCARHDAATVQTRADAAGIGNSRFRTPSEVVAHPHLADRDRWQEIDTPSGSVTALLPPPIIAGFAPPMGAVPGLGEHTETVLAAAGFAPSDIAELRDRGAIGTTTPAPSSVTATKG